MTSLSDDHTPKKPDEILNEDKTLKVVDFYDGGILFALTDKRIMIPQETLTLKTG